MALLPALILSAAKTGAGHLIKSADPAEQMRIRFDAAVQQADRELDQIFRAVITALFARATERLPTLDEVENLLAAAADGPARVYRLIGEARKTTSRSRRQMLAALLFGLQHSDLPEDDRDRVDMLIERLMPEDVKLLGDLARVEQLPALHPIGGEPPEWSGLTLVHDAHLIFAIASRQFRIGSVEWRDFNRLSVGVSQIPLSILENAGCVAPPYGAITTNVQVGTMSYPAHTLRITPLGRTLFKALEDVRPGIDAEDPQGKGGSARAPGAVL